MSPAIHTYDEEIEGFPDEPRLLELREESWRANGWSPVILGRKDAARHPGLRALERHIARHLPTVNHAAYELACYRRWCALQAAGGGWMADYDVINYTLRPDAVAGLGTGRLTFGLDHGDDARIVPCLVHGGPSDYQRAVDLFLDYRPGPADLHEGRRHCSDQTILRRRAGLLRREGRLDFLGCCRKFSTGDSAWRSSPVVHFPNKFMMQALKTPRSRWISMDPAVRLI